MNYFNPYLLRRLALLFGVFAFLSCGGGSVGTGTGDGRNAKTIQGTIVSNIHSPLPKVQVTLLETGESDITDANGEFFIYSAAAEGDVHIELLSEFVRATIVIPDIPETASGVRLDLVVRAFNVVGIRDIQITAQIRGLCDYYFENHRTIRQGNVMPDGTVCTVRVAAESGDQPLDIPIKLQRRNCINGSPWIDEDFSFTGQEADADGNVQSGVGWLHFTSADDADHCVYRVLAPANIEGIKPIVYEIHTLRKQNFDGRSEADYKTAR